MIANDNDGNIVRDAGIYFDVKTCSQNIQASKDRPIKIIDAFFVRLITKNIQADPLYRMKHQHRYSEEKIEKYG